MVYTITNGMLLLIANIGYLGLSLDEVFIQFLDNIIGTETELQKDNYFQYMLTHWAVQKNIY